MTRIIFRIRENLKWNIIYRKHVVCQVTREKKDESAVEDTNSFLKESSFALLTLQSAIPAHADLMEN